MCRMRVGTRWLGAALLWLAGCYSPQPTVKPPTHPEEYTIPPVEDSRFSSPIAFPKDTLNTDNPKKNDSQNGPGGPGSMPRGGPSMRAGGSPGGY
jgi:hypothetical protein